MCGQHGGFHDRPTHAVQVTIPPEKLLPSDWYKK